MIVKNRRNYYRVLQVQPDAAPDVIKASYRTLMQKLRFHPDLGGDNWNASVINEAYRVLSNSDRRAAYDAEQRSQMMGVGAFNRASNQRAQASRQQARSPGSAGPRESSAFKSMICVLCNQLTDVPTSLPGPRRCHTCRSPLTPVDATAPEQVGKRALPRLARSANVRYLRTQKHDMGRGNALHDDIVYHAVLEDISPEGMRLVTENALEIGELLRVECQLLSAVARVVVVRASSRNRRQFEVGTEFVTVDFALQKGSLLTEQA
ncbi:MAG: curved DNA-binding protein CbpA [Gammaproteobacteria bacterium]|jgi:curved DNA-binding protein CbpA